MAVTVLVVVVAAVALSARGSDPGPVVGSCFTYSAGDPRQVAAVVPCDQRHDGRVLAEADDRATCPEGTDAVLARGSGSGAVLCVDEQP